jgi:hypothetical protein
MSSKHDEEPDDFDVDDLVSASNRAVYLRQRTGALEILALTAVQPPREARRSVVVSPVWTKADVTAMQGRVLFETALENIRAKWCVSDRPCRCRMMREASRRWRFDL